MKMTISEVKNTLGWDKQITGSYIRKGWWTWRHSNRNHEQLIRKKKIPKINEHSISDSETAYEVYDIIVSTVLKEEGWGQKP